MVSPLRGQCSGFLELNAFLSVHLLFHPAVPRLTVHPREMKAYIHSKNGCTNMPKAALFTIIENWKQPRSLSVGENIHKLWYVHTMEYYSVTKKGTHFDTCINLDVSQVHCAQ